MTLREKLAGLRDGTVKPKPGVDLMPLLIECAETLWWFDECLNPNAWGYHRNIVRKQVHALDAALPDPKAPDA